MNKLESAYNKTSIPAPRFIRTLPNVPKDTENTTSGRISINKDDLNKIINDTIDETTLKLDSPVYTRLDMRVYMDILKQKIKEKLAKKIRKMEL